MQTLVPWAKLVALIEPHFPRSAKSRRPVGLECMLRIRLLQHWFKLADAACEEALYDSAALLAFSGIELTEVPVPDAITILEFRHRLDKSGLGHAVFAEVECNLLQRGLRVRVGTIVDAAILQARRRPQ